jgi:cellulose biosynthesis protein BcsQ
VERRRQRSVFAAVLAERGYRILVVDLDPQASASLWLGRGREPGL